MRCLLGRRAEREGLTRLSPLAGSLARAAERQSGKQGPKKQVVGSGSVWDGLSASERTCD